MALSLLKLTAPSVLRHSPSKHLTGALPQTPEAMVEAGANWWPMQMGRELEDAILQMRTNELDIGTWLIKTEGDAANVLASDALMLANKDHWFVRETIGLLRRTFSRLDVSSRSLFALIEAGSCFSGTLAGVGIGLRPQLPLGLARRRSQSTKNHRG